MADASIAAVLREQVADRQGPEDGTVVRFEYNFDLAKTKKERVLYTYTAIFIAATDRWYVSGQGDALNKAYSQTSFLDLLGKPNTVSAKVAIKFEAFKP